VRALRTSSSHPGDAHGLGGIVSAQFLDVWAVKLLGRVLAVVETNRGDVDSELLPCLPYRATDAATMQKQREDFRRIDGRSVA